jgi:hypothetical protein
VKWIFKFVLNLESFFFNFLKECDWIFPFPYLFFMFVQIFTPKKNLSWHANWNVSNHIVTSWAWIFVHDGCLNIFGNYRFAFIFILFLINYGLVTKSFGDGCTISKVLEKKCHKTNVHNFSNKLGWIISPSFWGAKSLEATIFYSDFQHNIPPLHGRANKLPCFIHRWSQRSYHEFSWNRCSD